LVINQNYFKMHGQQNIKSRTIHLLHIWAIVECSRVKFYHYQGEVLTQKIPESVKIFHDLQ
jgi:hypothetical protein